MKQAKKQIVTKSSSTPDSLETVAARAAESGATHDTAILQALREHVWKMLAAGGDPEKAGKIIAVIIAARRQELAEKNASNDEHHGIEEWFNHNVEAELWASRDSTSNGTGL
jgi:hypothetical protein